MNNTKEEQSRMIDRLRVVRELTPAEYKKLQRHEEKRGRLTAMEIALMFNFEISIEVIEPVTGRKDQQ